MSGPADSPRWFLFEEKTMNRMIVTGAAALFLVACSKESSAAPTVPTNAKVVMELGKDV